MAHEAIELERVPPVVVSGLPNSTPIFMRIWLMKMTSVLVRLILEVSFPQRLAHQARLQAHLRLAPSRPRSPLGRERGHRIDDDHIDRAERTSMSAISSACSPVSGCEISRSSVFKRRACQA